VGSGVVGVTPSSQVFVASSHSSTGTWNSEALLSSQEVFTIDSDSSLDFSQAACLPEAASAWALLHSFVTLSPGDVVLRSAEASPLNSALDQIAHAEGVVVIPASDSDLVDAQFKDKVASKGGGGARLAITSGTGQSARAMHALTGSKGVLVTYNGAIAPMTDSSSGVEVPSLALIFQDKAVCGFDFRSWVAHSPAQASQAISESVKLIQNGKLKFSPVAFTAAKFADAVESASSGKSVVIEL
jgi:NADPH:quinone reductase-like Zn-dependent oxidoreductase